MKMTCTTKTPKPSGAPKATATPRRTAAPAPIPTL